MTTLSSRAVSSPRPRETWTCRDRVVDLSSRALVMGVLNVTPDSFSDGGRYRDPEQAVERGLQMMADGAAIIDIGGESTRPGAEPVSAAEEIERVLPVLEGLSADADVLLSVDTSKAAVAEAALASGAHIINDVCALGADDAMAAVVARHGAGLVLMHMRGTPRTMQEAPVYTDVVDEVTTYLCERAALAAERGVGPGHIVVDPGIGFGKTVQHNLQLLAGLPRLARTGRPVLVGASRKSFIGEVTGRPVDERLPGSLAVAAYAIRRGARILRVHDVKESCDVSALMDMLDREERHDDLLGAD